MTRVALTWVVMALALVTTTASSQVHVTITDVGPGVAGRAIRAALRQSHRLVEPDTTLYIVPRDAVVRTPLIVLGRNTRIEGRVDGDVFVIGANLYVSVGAVVNGRVMAIGGGAYPSSLAYVSGEIESVRFSTFDISRSAEGYRLSYRSLEEPADRPLLFPLLYGFRLPSYDRVNGLSVPFGPAMPLGRDGGRIDVLATWRSNLGVVDPAIRASLQLTRRTRATFDAQRGTLSNDNWIYLDWLNSMSFLVFGDDSRNFYRADRAALSVFRLFERERIRWEPFAGLSWEDAASVGSTIGATGGPWTLFGNSDTLAARRANPAIMPGNTASAIVGTSVRWELDDTRVDARTRLEWSLTSPTSGFQQATTDATVAFPTFGEQEYAVEVHWVTSQGQVPAQRFAYLGGSGTLPFLEMLEQGGDELLLIDQRYSMPLGRVRFGDFGNPVLQFRHRVASAGIGRLPALEQVVGFGVSLTVIRGEIQFDPVSQRVRAAAGFTFSR